jgi:hypothetical protein
MRFKNYIIWKEGLIKTYPLNIAIRIMNNKWDKFLKKAFSEISNCFSGDVTNSEKSNLNFDLEKMKKDAESLGYFLSRVYKSGHYWNLTFSPKITTSDNFAPFSELYHFCPNSVLSKIRKIGITPRNSTKKDWPHPGDRIYLLKIEFDKMDLNNAEFNIDNIKELFEQIAKANNKEFKDYSFIKIKQSKDLLESLKIDPSFGKEENLYYGVYTNKNIPPSMFLKILKSEDFSKEIVGLVVQTFMKKYN